MSDLLYEVQVNRPVDGPRSRTVKSWLWLEEPARSSAVLLLHWHRGFAVHVSQFISGSQSNAMEVTPVRSAASSFVLQPTLTAPQMTSGSVYSYCSSHSIFPSFFFFSFLLALIGKLPLIPCALYLATLGRARALMETRCGASLQAHRCILWSIHRGKTTQKQHSEANTLLHTGHNSSSSLLISATSPLPSHFFCSYLFCIF